ncbi:hypothetical protein Shyhy01_04200 [Streptomyces hygroscopicus subsp. hygroscopicus]|nr:hypothetical protein [Streptomyces hygroscopicus]GLX47470.1 hypothetical protein Shyhy01_04200 [Streptomyces hygroscopicus subsp. hygroscopicus]
MPAHLAPAEGTVLHPLAGDPLTGRIRLARNRAAVSERRAGLLYRAAARAYLDSIPNDTFYRAWCESRPEPHPVLDRESRPEPHPVLD